MKPDGEANRRAWKHVFLILAAVFVSSLIQTHSLVSSALGVAVAAPLLFVIPPIYMTVRRRTGSDLLAGGAAIVGGLIYAASVIGWIKLIFFR
jgi:hypothetical protein